MKNLIKWGVAAFALWWLETRGGRKNVGDGLWPTGMGIPTELWGIFTGIEVCSDETGDCASGESPGGESDGTELFDET